MNRFNDAKSKIFYHKMLEGNQNPLAVKLGESFLFPQEIDIKDANLFCHAISVGHFEDDYQYTDYHLNGNCPTLNHELNFRLRVQKDYTAQDAQILLLEISEQSLFEKNSSFKTDHISINYDEEGTRLTEPRIYWRVDNNSEPMQILVQKLSQVNLNSTLLSIKSENYLDCWDFYRQTVDCDGVYYIDFLFIEQDRITKNQYLLKGPHIPAKHIIRNSEYLTSN